MLRRPLLATTTVSATALALALVAPGVALAAPGGAGESGRPSQPGSAPQTPPGQNNKQETPPAESGAPAEQPGRSGDAPGGAAQGQPTGKQESKPKQAGREKSASAGKSADAGKPAGPAKKSSPPAQQAGGGGDKAAANKNEAGDPPGNNGTIKISSVPVGEGRGNVPHPGCEFALVHYGFDAGQTANITFTHHAPTGGGETLLRQSGVTISDDAAGGGQDRDAVFTYTAADLGLTGAAPHRKGWHVKVAVDALEAPGGAKQKVFWLNCPAGEVGSETENGAGGGQTGGTTDGATSTEGGGSASTVESVSVLDSTRTRTLAGSLVSPTAAPQSGPSVGVLSALASRSAGPAAGGETAASATSVRPSALPFTGTQALPALLAMSAIALAVGAGLLRAGARRQTV